MCSFILHPYTEARGWRRAPGEVRELVIEQLVSSLRHYLSVHALYLVQRLNQFTHRGPVPGHWPHIHPYHFSMSVGAVVFAVTAPQVIFSVVLREDPRNRAARWILSRIIYCYYPHSCKSLRFVFLSKNIEGKVFIKLFGLPLLLDCFNSL